MIPTEQQPRSGARRLTKDQADTAIMRACEHTAALYLAAKLTGQPINRDGLRTQLVGLQPLLADGVQDDEHSTP